MATRGEWQRLINLSHEMALIEDHLRETAGVGEVRESGYAMELLREHFGVDSP